MSRKIAILLSMVYLLATTPFSEVLKLPIFVEHYLEYEGDFVDFMVHHYGGHEKDEDWDTDQKLPFMNLSQTLLFAAGLPDDQVLLEENRWRWFLRGSPVLADSSLTPGFTAAIFQPPRSC